MELFVIGKAARPRSFPKSFQPKRDLDVRYAHNKPAWMTAAEFGRWITGVNSDMKRCVLNGCCRADKCADFAMPVFSASLQICRPRTCLVLTLIDVLLCRRKRNIVVLSDNAPTHMLADTEIDEEHGFKVINLSNLKLVFLPANTTIVVQPLDQGIIACTKAHYRRQLVQWVIAEAEKPENAGKSLKEVRPSFYQMMRWLNTAWKECVSPLTIRNCWHKAGILTEGWIAAPTGTHAQAAQPATDSAAESEDEVEFFRDVDSCADAAATEDADQAFQQLDTALQGLQVCVQKHGTLLPHNDVIMSAHEFHQLDGEREVFEELDDAAIVQMIRSDNAADVVDSDEADDFVDVTTTKAQALQVASDLHEFPLAQPQLFHAPDVAKHAQRSRQEHEA
jgi:hypothetical protein